LTRIATGRPWAFSLPANAATESSEARSSSPSVNELGPGLSQAHGQAEADAVARAGHHGQLPAQIGYGYVFHKNPQVSAASEASVPGPEERIHATLNQGSVVRG
jgi:hypothetical protein